MIPSETLRVSGVKYVASGVKFYALVRAHINRLQNEAFLSRKHLVLVSVFLLFW